MIRGGTHPDDPNADDRGEETAYAKRGGYMSQAEQDALSDRRADQDAA